MIKRGSQGNEVKEMQGHLRKAGLFDHPKDTGFFGPKTEKSLKEFQKLRGIKQDGIYGPRSKDMLENNEHALALVHSPHIQGTPHQEVLQRMYSGGDHRINAGHGGVHVTPANLKNKLRNI